MKKEIIRVIEKADKYVRNKSHRCLFPNCEEESIYSHSIQRAAIEDALSVDGHIYTLKQSFIPVIKRKSSSEPLGIVPIGVNKAGTFKGYCSIHDNALFYKAETVIPSHKNGMSISLHLRALSLEYCRKRMCLDFYSKQYNLATDIEYKTFCHDNYETYKNTLDFQKTYSLDKVFSLIFGNPNIEIDYLCIPFSKNLLVSCCGVFTIDQNYRESDIGYNLISFPDCSILVLTCIKGEKNFIDPFVEQYNSSYGIKKLINDIAFRYCEEPIISPVLWESLSDDQKYNVGISIRHPDERIIEVDSNIINISKCDIMGIDPISLSVLSKRFCVDLNDLQLIVSKGMRL